MQLIEIPTSVGHEKSASFTDVPDGKVKTEISKTIT